MSEPNDFHLGKYFVIKMTGCITSICNRFVLLQLINYNIYVLNYFYNNNFQIV